MTMIRAKQCDTLAARLEPTREAIDDSLRQLRRAMVDVRHATEDAVAETALKIRRHPMASVGIAAGAGALAGVVMGFSVGRLLRSRR